MLCIFLIVFNQGKGYFENNMIVEKYYRGYFLL